MQPKWQRIFFVFAFTAILGGVLYAGRDMFQSSSVGSALSLVDGVAKGVSHYAGSNGGVIPQSGDLLGELEKRHLLATDYKERLPGYSLPAIRRLGPAEFQIHLSCPPDAQGKQACDQILDAKTPAADAGVLRSAGRGTGKITIDMRL